MVVRLLLYLSWSLFLYDCIAIRSIDAFFGRCCGIFVGVILILCGLLERALAGMLSFGRPLPCGSRAWCMQFWWLTFSGFQIIQVYDCTFSPLYLFLIIDCDTDCAELYSYHPARHFFFCVATGYFIWDLFDAFQKKDFIFSFHALASIWTFFFALHPFAQCIMSQFLGWFELSTPVYHAMELMRIYGWETKHPSAVRATEALFALTFLIARVVIGSFVSFTAWQRLIVSCLLLSCSGWSWKTVRNRNWPASSFLCRDCWRRKRIIRWSWCIGTCCQIPFCKVFSTIGDLWLCRKQSQLLAEYLRTKCIDFRGYQVNKVKGWNPKISQQYGW